MRRSEYIAEWTRLHVEMRENRETLQALLEPQAERTTIGAITGVTTATLASWDELDGEYARLECDLRKLVLEWPQMPSPIMREG